MSHKLYNETWKSWSNKGKNPHSIKPPFEEFDAVNSSCGDAIRIKIRIQNNQVQALGFEATGCSICLGTIAFLSDYLPGKRMDEAIELLNAIEKTINGTLDSKNFNHLSHFKLLQEFPTRVKCVKLSTSIVKKAILSRQ